MAQQLETKVDFGARLRAVREERGETEAGLGAIVGVTGGAIGQYERGVIYPQRRVLAALERWMADPASANPASENTLLNRRIALIEARLARLEEKCDEWDEKSDSIQLAFDDLVKRNCGA